MNAKVNAVTEMIGATKHHESISVPGVMLGASLCRQQALQGSF